MKHLILIVCAIALFSCEDDYLIDGGTASPHLNMSTYEFLSSNSLFDTLVMAIDKAGLQGTVDGEVTLFAPTHFSFRNYIDVRTALGRTLYNDPNYVFAFDSIPVRLLQDSLAMYIFPGKLTRDSLTKEGKVYTNLAGTQLRLSLEPREEYTTQLTVNPEYVYLTRKRGTRWDAWDATGVTTNEQDTKERAQTSNLLSTNGVIHVLANGHVLFFTRTN
jgi:hypothetical protein